ncbi:MAG: hypothetical protein IKK23_03135, partial [Bacteroidales bacterium]|nr:hypothetical protein [Bacteroidales bacterium]
MKKIFGLIAVIILGMASFIDADAQNRKAKQVAEAAEVHMPIIGISAAESSPASAPCHLCQCCKKSW